MLDQLDKQKKAMQAESKWESISVVVANWGGVVAECVWEDGRGGRNSKTVSKGEQIVTSLSNRPGEVIRIFGIWVSGSAGAAVLGTCQ